jgi:CRISPR/Cas system-associated endoribonuclease Cas2
VANDWRVTVTLQDAAHAGRVQESLHEHEVEDDARHRLGHRVAVSADGPSIFLYAATENAAREAEQVARELTAKRDLSAEFALDRWHPVEEEWESSDVALPQTDEERAAEHQRLEAEETQESLATGNAQWEVRVDLPSHHAAVELADRLQAEGRTVIRRWTLLVLGANDEDDAKALAQVIKQEAPAGATVQAQELGPLLPFTRIAHIPIW